MIFSHQIPQKTQDSASFLLFSIILSRIVKGKFGIAGK